MDLMCIFTFLSLLFALLYDVGKIAFTLSKKTINSVIIWILTLAHIIGRRNEAEKKLSFLQKRTRDMEMQMAKFSSELDGILNKLGNAPMSFSQEIKQMEENLSEQLNQKVATINEKIQKINKEVDLTQLEDLLHRKPSTSHLMDNLLFGSENEQMLFEALCCKWTIKYFDELEPNEICTSEVIPIYGYDLKIQLKLTNLRNGTVYFELCVMDGESKVEEALSNNYRAMVTFIIKDCSGKRVKNDKISYRYHSLHNSSEFNKFTHWAEVEKAKLDTLISPFHKSLEVLVLVEPPLNIYRNLVSTDGTVTDTVHFYNEKLRGNLMYDHWSPMFFTGPAGYRMVARIFLNKRIEGGKRGLETWLHFLYFECDEKLPLEFKHEITIQFVHPKCGIWDIKLKQNKDTAESYKMISISDEAIVEGGFIKNNTLTYRVIITPVN